MREIVERGELAEVEGRDYLVVPVSGRTIDALAAFKAEGEIGRASCRERV